MADHFHVAELHAFSDLRAHAPELFACEAEDLFSSAAWSGTLHAHGFATALPLRVLVARSASRRAPLALPMAGSGEVGALANYYSCLYGPITSGPAIEAPALQAMLQHLRAARARPVMLRFAPLDGAAAFARALRPALAAAGYLADDYFCFGNWYLEVAGRSYASVFAGLPATLRNTVLRRERRLSREGACSIVIESAGGAALEAAIAAALAEIAADAGQRFGSIDLILELGRYLVGEAGIYVTRIVDRKESRGHVFLVTDGGLNHHLAASGNFGQVLRKNYPLAIGNRMGAPAAAAPVSVVGPLCTPLDLLGDNVMLPEARAGDLVVVYQSGAYGASASPQAFLGHPPVTELLV